MMLMAIRSRPKRTISTNSGLGLLQTVSEADTGRCASEDAGPPRGWIVRSHVGWSGEGSIPCKSVEIFP